MARPKKDNNKKSSVTVNKKAYRNFEIIDKYEAGMSLTGSEVKSLRAAAADLDGAYARIQGNECWLVGATIAQYEQSGIYNHEPTRKRKLLLHRREIAKIRVKLEQRGFTFVPLKIYFNDRGLAKTQIALVRGKRQYDKRREIAKRDADRAIDRALANQD